ncbi:hypothetical protein [Enterococcus faecium]|uniref:hypothetical protein n=1 Tax=Enterococcus faecium TaxID=1352 RepID=UPI00220DD232|nr:hypothetical protein [Enterococcus faecium]BDP97123.1 hypothetical protein EfmGK961_09390 [Enterococcus faecium]
MWIETKTDKNGKTVYKYNERFFDPKTRKRKKDGDTYKNKSRETQKVALLELNKKIDIKLNEKTLHKPDLTFHELVEEWLVI